MRLLELLGLRDSGTDVTTSNESAGGTVLLQFQQPSAAEFYESESNALADMAMEWGLDGKWVVAEYAAALADAYADLGRVHRWIEDYKDFLQRSA